MVLQSQEAAEPRQARPCGGATLAGGVNCGAQCRRRCGSAAATRQRLRDPSTREALRDEDAVREGLEDVGGRDLAAGGLPEVCRGAP